MLSEYNATYLACRSLPSFDDERLAVAGRDADSEAPQVRVSEILIFGAGVLETFDPQSRQRVDGTAFVLSAHLTYLRVSGVGLLAWL